MIDYSGQVVVVTGAGAGLGRSYALELGRRGATVVVNDIGLTDDRQSSAEVVAQEITAAGGTATADRHGVHDPAESVQIVRDAVSRFGRIDAFISNAGTTNFVPVDTVSIDDFDRQHAVHLRGPFAAMQEAFRSMSERQYGRIVIISSTAGVFGRPAGGAYSVAKMGLLGLMNVLSIDGESRGVLVNALCPSAVTSLAGKGPAVSIFGERAVLALERTRDLFGSPAFTAPMLAFLASRQCDVTRHVYTTHGGRYARIFSAINEGWLYEGSEPPTVEEIAEHFTDIDAPIASTAPSTALDELIEVAERRHLI